MYENSLCALGIWQNWRNGLICHSRIEVLHIAQLLALVTFVSVSLMRENLRGLRESFKHKIRTLGSGGGITTGIVGCRTADITEFV